MSILDFKNFFNKLNENVDLPILDIVIDDVGNVYNGTEKKLVKGRVERQKGGGIVRILGTDNKQYPAGIDRNGNVVSIQTDEDGKALNSEGNAIKIPIEIQRKYKVKSDYYYIGTEGFYQPLVPIAPTGWVNVKIDMEIVKRVKRYSRALGTNKLGHQSFLDKLAEFERLSNLKRREGDIKRLKRGSIQKEMSCILLLHYINEIKDFFTPSSSGFLFESFIAGLIPNARVKEDNSPVDIRSGEDRYQLKLMDHKTEYIPITQDITETNQYLEYYVISLKYVDRIEVIVIDGQELERQIEEGSIPNLVTNGMRFKVQNLLKHNDSNLLQIFKIDLTDIESRIKNLGESLKENLDKLYEELSKFQYNVETIITGTDQKGRVMRSQAELDNYFDLAQGNIKNLEAHLRNLVTDISK